MTSATELKETFDILFYVMRRIDRKLLFVLFWTWKNNKKKKREVKRIWNVKEKREVHRLDQFTSKTESPSSQLKKTFTILKNLFTWELRELFVIENEMCLLHMSVNSFSYKTVYYTFVMSRNNNPSFLHNPFRLHFSEKKCKYPTNTQHWHQITYSFFFLINCWN